MFPVAVTCLSDETGDHVNLFPVKRKNLWQAGLHRPCSLSFGYPVPKRIYLFPVSDEKKTGLNDLPLWLCISPKFAFLVLRW